MDLDTLFLALLKEEVGQPTRIDLCDGIVFADDFEIRALRSGKPGRSFAIMKLVLCSSFGSASIMSEPVETRRSSERTLSYRSASAETIAPFCFAVMGIGKFFMEFEG